MPDSEHIDSKTAKLGGIVGMVATNAAEWAVFCAATDLPRGSLYHGIQTGARAISALVAYKTNHKQRAVTFALPEMLGWLVGYGTGIKIRESFDPEYRHVEEDKDGTN